MGFFKYQIVFAICLSTLMACSSNKEAVRSTDISGGAPWTLDFFYFYKGKQTHSKSFEYSSRRDCFEALYAMQVATNQQPLHNGSGIGTKWFYEGQLRTHNDELGYR